MLKNPVLTHGLRSKSKDALQWWERFIEIYRKNVEYLLNQRKPETESAEEKLRIGKSFYMFAHNFNENFMACLFIYIYCDSDSAIPSSFASPFDSGGWAHRHFTPSHLTDDNIVEIFNRLNFNKAQWINKLNDWIINGYDASKWLEKLSLYVNSDMPKFPVNGFDYDPNIKDADSRAWTWEVRIPLNKEELDHVQWSKIFLTDKDRDEFILLNQEFWKKNEDLLAQIKKTMVSIDDDTIPMKDHIKDFLLKKV